MSKSKLGALDVVYILGKGSHWQDNELRYSLRSIEENLNHGKVFVVGECPDWLQNVTHIEAIDGFPHKIKNAIHKIRTACLDHRISEDFILMNDDFFFLNRTEAIKNFHLGNINKAIAEHQTKDGYYYRALIDTRNLLNVAGAVEVLNYEVHYPMVFNRKKFLELTDSVSWHDAGYLFRSLYGNIYEIGGQKRSDVKIYHLSDFIKFKSGDLISTNDRVVLTPQFQLWIMGRFKNPSKYEKIY